MRKNITRWFKRNRIHIWLWIFYIFYENVFIGILFNTYAHPLIYLVHYLVIIAFFYLHAEYLLPKVLSNKKFGLWKAFMVIVLEIPLYIILHHLANHLLVFFGLLRLETVKLDMEFVLRNCYRGFYFMSISTGYYFLKNFLNERRRKEQLEREKLHDIIKQQRIEQELANAQHAYLKAQINPHFLFNTLDFIYHHVNSYSEVAGDAIVRLAEMMRFAIDSAQIDGKILLADEIDQVNNLIHLNQIRKNHQLNLKFTYSAAVTQFRIIPLIILTLAENIFKHGNLSNSAQPATIAINIEEKQLEITTRNLSNHIESTTSYHTGMLNIKKRLHQVYGDKVMFNWSSENQQFFVKINIPIELLK